MHKTFKYFGQENLQNFGLKSSFFFGILLKISRKNISSSISFILIIINLKVVLKQLLNLPNLPKIQFFYIHKAKQIVVICKSKNLIFTIF